MIINEKYYNAYRLREEGSSWVDIGNTLGISRKTAKRYYEKYNYSSTGNWQDLKERVKVSDLTRFNPVHIHGDAVISCDWHVPLHSISMVWALIEKANALKIKQLAIVGDFFNMDSLSHYTPHQSEAALDIEREEAIYLFDILLDEFEHIYLSWGNHDFRFIKHQEHKLSFEYCIRWLLERVGEKKLSRLTVTDLDHMVYHPGNYDIRLCHQNQFSKVSLSLGKQLAAKYNMSILTAHSHHFAQGVAPDGRNLVFEGGGLFDPQKTEYIQRTTTHHNWVQGFYIWKHGDCYPFSPVYHNL